MINENFGIKFLQTKLQYPNVVSLYIYIYGTPHLLQYRYCQSVKYRVITNTTIQKHMPDVSTVHKSLR